MNRCLLRSSPWNVTAKIVIGIVCAIVADLLFSPRSIKQEVDRELDALIVAQYQLMQLCIKHGDSEEVDKAWSALVRRTQALEGMRSNLNMESSAGSGPTKSSESDQYRLVNADHPGV